MNGMIDPEDRERALAWLTSGVGLSHATQSQLELFVHELIGEASKQNLISAATIPIIWWRHIVDCAQLIRYVPRETSTWVDLGSGAGLPGLVCAALLPEVRFTLIEQRPLRTDWLTRAVARMSLVNVEVVTSNVAATTRRHFDVISARAFAPLPRLIDLSAAFSTSDTTWVLPKGRSAQQEVDDLQNWHHTFHVEQSVTDPHSGIIVGSLIGRKGEGR